MTYGVADELVGGDVDGGDVGGEDGGDVGGEDGDDVGGGVGLGVCLG